MFDQQRAFEWVQTNIEKFGGDPAKVTIHGQSGMNSRIRDRHFETDILVVF